MGGDNAPHEIIKGAIESLSMKGFDMVLVGDENIIKEELALYPDYDSSRVSILHASEVISNDESPVFALRRKKDSSTVKGISLVKGDFDSAFISAGSTGATLAGGLLIAGRLPGIDRPSLAVAIPAAKGGHFLLIDNGANVDCSVENLVQFAQMGSIYTECVFGTSSPRVGLVNNGAEAHKGCSLTKTAYEELQKLENINFTGNVEPRYLFSGQVDVAVCDGFVGNAILKCCEGLGMMIFSELKNSLHSGGFLTKIGALLVKKKLYTLKSMFNYEEYGGAPFLGVNANIIKIHGSSKSSSVYHAVKQAQRMIENRIVEKISDKLSQNIQQTNN